LSNVRTLLFMPTAPPPTLVIISWIVLLQLSRQLLLSIEPLSPMAVRAGDSAAANSLLLLIVFLACCLVADAIRTHGGGYLSAVGDPGMRRDGLRVAWEAWNFCNEVGQEAPGMGSPRGADCFDIGKTNFHIASSHSLVLMKMLSVIGL
jgi:hypothetical protein